MPVNEINTFYSTVHLEIKVISIVKKQTNKQTKNHRLTTTFNLLPGEVDKH